MHNPTDDVADFATHHVTNLRTWWEAFSDSYTIADIHATQCATHYSATNSQVC